MMIDGFSYLTERVCNISAQPIKAMTDCVADKIAPSYWKPNAEITVRISILLYQLYVCHVKLKFLF